MCGRYVSSSTPDEIGAYFDAELTEETAIEPSWNVAPTDDVHVVLVEDGVRRVAAHHWGLVPRWAKDPSVGSRMINARAETLATKGAFKHAFARRRCLVPADGFYEWDKVSGQRSKQPYFIHRPEGELLAFAGLWEDWRGPEGDGPQHLRSASIVTTTPNDLMARIHDRMPVVLPDSAWDAWLDPDGRDVDALARLLVPAPDGVLVMHPVGREVGNVRNDGPQLIHEVDPLEPVASGGPEQLTLPGA